MKLSNIKKNLQKKLRSAVESAIYNRGLNYYNSGHVQTINVSEQGKKLLIDGKVRGTKNYKSELTFDEKKDNFNELNCDCPYGVDCKHSVALGLEFISRYSDFLKGNSNYILEELLNYFNGREKPQNTEIQRNTDKKEADGYNNFETLDKNKRYWEEYNNRQLQLLKDNEISKNTDKYHIIISEVYYGAGSGWSLKICNNKGVFVMPTAILKTAYKLSAPQIKLFKWFESYNLNKNNDYEKLFLLIKEAGYKIYWNKKNKNNELKFAEEENSYKLKTQLIKQKNEFSGEDEYIFVLDKAYFKKKCFKFIHIKDGFIKLENNKINFMLMPPVLIPLVTKAYSNNYFPNFHGSSNGTALSEEEIINLNQILDASYQYLDFSTNLKSHYNIQKFNIAEPCIIIDYNRKKDILEAKIMVDYGFKKIDIAESISRSCYKGRDEFQRYGADNYIIEIKNNNIFYASIKKNFEISLYKTIYSNWQEYGFKKNITCRIEGEKEIYKFIDKNLPYLERLHYRIEYVRDKFELVRNKFNADFDIDLNTENDWLSFDVACYCGEDKINLEILRKYVKNKVKNGYIKLDDGRLWKISNEEELGRFIRMLEAFYEKEANKFEGRIYHAPELEGLFENSKYYKGRMSESFKEFMDEAKRGKSVKKVKLPCEFDNILRDYQKEGINWFYFLRKYRFGGILADDMGTGKTLQTLTLLNMNRNNEKPSIVICPKSLLYNWTAEVEKFTPKFKTIVLDGLPSERMGKIKLSSQYDLIITSYATMQRDFEYYQQHKIKFNYCILDEAQFIKNHKTKNARSVKKIDADYRLVLTGTPLENSVSELWSIFDFLMPGFLGNNTYFNEKFQNPIMKRNCNETLNNLRKKIECFMLRRTKEDVLKELPPKIEQYNYCYLEPSQNILYQEILANVRNEIFKVVKEQGFAKSQIHILAGLTKLRQVCNHPNLLLGEKDYKKYESAKLNIFNELIEEIVSSGRKVLVFSQFTTMLDILSQELKNTPHNYLSGKTNNRQELVDDFNNNANKKVFLISLKAGGTGLNLTSADNVIIFDPWWNPSVERQAIDRTHRIGQTKSVNVYRFITKGTIEEKIIKLQERKKILFDNLISESKDLFKKLTWDEVKELFK